MPNLYELKCTLLRSDEIIHSLSTFVGFRKIEIHPDKGFILNEKRVKLQGVCEHTESGALGAVYDGAFMKRRILLLKDIVGECYTLLPQYAGFSYFKTN